MTQYVGLDVSLKMTAVCVVDETGGLTAKSKVASEPEALGGWLREHAPAARRIGMETGPLAVWRSKYGGLEVSEARRLKVLEEENRKLKKLLAEQMLDGATLREMLAKDF